MITPSADEQTAIRYEAIGADDEDALPGQLIEHHWNHSGAFDIYLTAAACCDALAAAIAIKIPRWSADGESIDRTQQPAWLRQRALELRALYGSGGLAAVSGQLILGRVTATATATSEFST